MWNRKGSYSSDNKFVSGRTRTSQTPTVSDEIAGLQPLAGEETRGWHGGEVVSTGSSTQVTRRGIFPRLRDARIRAKLALILFVPLAAVIVLATARLVDVSGQATAAGQVQKLTELGSDVSALTQLLHGERMQAAAFLAAANGPSKGYDDAVKATDAGIASYRTHRQALEDPPVAVQSRLVQIDDN